jgi:hypothetical protein
MSELVMVYRFAGAAAALLLAACTGFDTPSGAEDTATETSSSSRDVDAQEPDSCAACVYALLESSPHFKQNCNSLLTALERNGGALGMSLDGSPAPERHGAASLSTDFHISVFESYPTHNHNLHRYTFSPSTERLAVESLIDDFDGPRDSTLSYDPALLPAFRRHCVDGKRENGATIQMPL